MGGFCILDCEGDNFSFFVLGSEGDFLKNLEDIEELGDGAVDDETSGRSCLNKLFITGF